MYSSMLMAFEVSQLFFSKLVRFSIIHLRQLDRLNQVSCFSPFFPPGLRSLGRHQTLLFLPHLLSTESVEEKGGGPPRCSIAELLQMCWPSLTEDCAASHATLSQQLDQILQSLRGALELPGTGPSVWEQIRPELGRGSSWEWRNTLEQRLRTPVVGPTSPLVSRRLANSTCSPASQVKGWLTLH